MSVVSICRLACGSLLLFRATAAFRTILSTGWPAPETAIPMAT